jgi:hydroxybutyrate-dimer hydrolase
MYAHLKIGAAIPPSQVVRTTPRTSSNSVVTKPNVPDIPATPAPADQITFSNGTLNIPN